jgi:hypothetical protein
MRRLLESYGFAFLIFMALACACLMAGTAAIPEPVPDFALRAPEIYRLEIGAAFFGAFYLATLAFLLALSGRGFAEVGTRGLKIDQVVNSSTALRHQAQIDLRTRKTLKALDAAVDGIQAEMASHQNDWKDWKPIARLLTYGRQKHSN